MIARIIRGSIANRALVLMAAVLLAVAGLWSVLHTPLDALPDLSDTQVIIRTEWGGQTPRIIEDQVTYPLATTMLSVPGVRAVRGLFVLRRLVRLRPVRRRYRPLLGAFASTGIPEPGARPVAGRRQSIARPRRHRTGVDLRVRLGRPDRSARRRAAASATGLVPALRAQDHPGRGRGRQHRRHGAGLADRARSAGAGRTWTYRRPTDGGHRGRQRCDRRFGDRTGRSRTDCAQRGLSAQCGRLRTPTSDDCRR